MLGRIAVAAVVGLGTSLFLGNTPARNPIFGVLVIVLIYSCFIAYLLAKKRLLAAFFLGLLFDNACLLAGWILSSSAQHGLLITNDLYLVIVPMLVIGVARLG